MVETKIIKFIEKNKNNLTLIAWNKTTGNPNNEWLKNKTYLSGPGLELNIEETNALTETRNRGVVIYFDEIELHHQICLPIGEIFMMGFDQSKTARENKTYNDYAIYDLYFHLYSLVNLLNINDEKFKSSILENLTLFDKQIKSIKPKSNDGFFSNGINIKSVSEAIAAGLQYMNVKTVNASSIENTITTIVSEKTINAAKEPEQHPKEGDDPIKFWIHKAQDIYEKPSIHDGIQTVIKDGKQIIEDLKEPVIEESKRIYGDLKEKANQNGFGEVVEVVEGAIESSNTTESRVEEIN